MSKVTINEITITLNEEEAVALHDVLGFVAGDRSKSRRKHLSPIWQRLNLLLGEPTPIPADITGCIEFM